MRASVVWIVMANGVGKDGPWCPDSLALQQAKTSHIAALSPGAPGALLPKQRHTRALPGAGVGARGFAARTVGAAATKRNGCEAIFIWMSSQSTLRGLVRGLCQASDKPLAKENSLLGPPLPNSICRALNLAAVPVPLLPQTG